MTIHCLLIDDEPPARRILQSYLKRVNFLHLEASCSKPLDALPILNKQSIQLLFLDINMPGLSGINFLKSLANPPLVIFTTAYPEHAVEGFELNALDYLLKPFSFERFLQAVNKAHAALSIQAQLTKNSAPPAAPHLLLKADKKTYRLPFNELLYFQAYGDYVKVFTKTQQLTPKTTLQELANKLPDSHFIRIHRSYIIAIHALTAIEGNRLSILDTTLPISNSYRKNLLARLKGE